MSRSRESTLISEVVRSLIASLCGCALRACCLMIQVALLAACCSLAFACLLEGRYIQKHVQPSGKLKQSYVFAVLFVYVCKGYIKPGNLAGDAVILHGRPI